MRLAQIEDGIIVNVIEVDPAAMPDWASDWPKVDQAGPGWTFDGADFIPPPESTAALSEVCAAAIDSINSAIGQARTEFITDLPGQEMLYLVKEDEAGRFIKDLDADLENYPLIAAEIGITGPTAYEVAQVYLNLGAQFRQIGAQLETIRLGHIAQVEIAETATDVTVVLASFADAMGAIQGSVP
ncbi:hypothetical protein SAMN05444389_102426 [Paracoccus solventivorans]|uniref:Uncharacterized protein n=1 Tax=Paracoccus solventivorans TaxID=53463 RepID=A0A1M7EZA8_9RHOB|nr:hypothetical protein [Paracoccus solventivorans]SHL97053.1 hypothetical protein SAMN05444389_102426 [Paracoccus solventivorans]